MNIIQTIQITQKLLLTLVNVNKSQGSETDKQVLQQISKMRDMWFESSVPVFSISVRPTLLKTNFFNLNIIASLKFWL
jgi:hypothetical protein